MQTDSILPQNVELTPEEEDFLDNLHLEMAGDLEDDEEASGEDETGEDDEE